MKLMFFDFECPQHGAFEELVKPDIHTAPCPQCGTNAVRQISAPRIGHMQMATSASASPESIRKWERAHRQQKAKEEKQYASHGDYPGMASAD
jgi:putative FmdB family regulatory protein